MVPLDTKGIGPKHEVWISLSPTQHLEGNARILFDYWVRTHVNEFTLHAMVRSAP